MTVHMMISPCRQVSNVEEGTYSYLDAGGEQTIVELTPTKRITVTGVWLDLVNMTKNGTIKAYYKIDGSNYREYDSASFLVAYDPDGLLMAVPFTVDADWKLTYEETADEGAARDILYQVFWDEKE